MAFLLDENVSPRVARFLATEGYRAEHVPAVLGPGADDTDAILPYAPEEDLVIVTGDVTDFVEVADDRHRGLLVVYDQRLTAFDLANAVLDVVDAYGSRDHFDVDVLDDWV